MSPSRRIYLHLNVAYRDSDGLRVACRNYRKRTLFLLIRTMGSWMTKNGVDGLQPSANSYAFPKSVS